MNSANVLPGIRICGFSGSGKTTLIEQLIPIFRQRGYHPACFKHSGHPHRLNPPQKDTGRFANAGAEFCAIGSSDQSALYGSASFSLDWAFLWPNSDLVFMEGFSNRSPEFPALILRHPEKGFPPDITHAIGCVTREPGEPSHPNLPVMNAAEVETIADFITEYLKNFQTKRHPLIACILIGGQSTRMGEEKFTLCYGKTPQYRRIFELLKKNFPSMPIRFVGKREQKTDLEELAEFFTEDCHSGNGPYDGITTIAEQFPERALAVFGVDYPLLDEEVLQTLFQARNPLKPATLFTTSEGIYETVCGIYEPAFFPRHGLARIFDAKPFRPQKFLHSLNLETLIPSESCRKKLKSVDTSEEFLRIQKQIQ